MKREVLEQLAKEGKSTRQIAKITGYGQTTVRYWLKKHQVSTNPTSPMICKKCGEKDPDRMMNKGADRKSNTLCKSCHNLQTIERQKKNKQVALDYKGGKCMECGYHRCLAALEFHHADPSKKDPNWTNLRSWGIERIYKELDKCELLCANCHRERHYLGVKS